MRFPLELPAGDHEGCRISASKDGIRVERRRLRGRLRGWTMGCGCISSSGGLGRICLFQWVVSVRLRNDPGILWPGYYRIAGRIDPDPAGLGERSRSAKDNQATALASACLHRASMTISKSPSSQGTKTTIDERTGSNPKRSDMVVQERIIAIDRRKARQVTTSCSAGRLPAKPGSRACLVIASRMRRD